MIRSTSFRPDDLVVNYHDACLHGRDLAILRSSGWLNADCIHYQLQRLQQEYCCSVSSRTLLLDPSVVSFFMHQCEDDDEIEDFANGYDRFRDAVRLLVPISDDMKPSAHWNNPGRGTHWSLLVLIWDSKKEDDGTKPCPRALHFDSIPGSGNAQAACAVAAKFYKLLERLDLVRLTELSMRECPVPRQKNGYDCGVHVLVTADLLVRDNECDETQVEDRLKELFKTKPAYCSELRNRIADDALMQAANSDSK